MTTNTSAQTGERAGAREWTGLGVLALPSLLLSLDLSVLFLALPNLSADLNPTAPGLLWIVDIYGFMIAGFLVTMGSLGDRIGRRRLLMIGAAAFGAASVVAAYSSSPGMLIAARALMGVAGATLQPSTLALISNMFRNPKQRAVAISLWMTSFMVGLAAGPIVGGLMLEFFWWGSVFLLGVPVMGLLLVTAPVLLPEYRDTQAGRLDLISVVLSLVTILPIIYGLKEVAKDGLTVPTTLAIVVGAAAGVVFIRRERGMTSPLFDLRLLGNRSVSGALVVLLLSSAAVSGVLLFFTQYLQLVEGLPPLRTGLLIIPYTVGVIAGSLASPAIAQRVRPGFVVAIGLAIGTIGFLIVSQVQNLPGLVLLEIGLVEDQAADVAAFLDAVGLDSAVIAGHSMGSYVAQRFAIDHPGRTAALVLLGAFRAIAGDPAIEEFRAELDAIEDPVPEELAREFQESTITRPLAPGQLEQAIAESCKVPVHVWRAALDGLLGAVPPTEAGTITAPTRLIWGDHDAYIPREEQERLAAAIPEAELLVYEGTGHAVHWEEPARAAADVAAFVSLRGSRRPRLAAVR